MDPNREIMLKEVMAADFTAFDLHLYLNTHPCDMRALALFRSSVQRAKMISDNFERMYGPLTSHGYFSDPNRWQWIDSPWPWERQ